MADPFNDMDEVQTYDIVFLSKGEVPPADFMPEVPDIELDCMPLWTNPAIGSEATEVGDDLLDLANYTGRRLFVGSIEEGGYLRHVGNPELHDKSATHLDADGNVLGEVDHEEMLKQHLAHHGFFAGDGEQHAEEHRRLWGGGSASDSGTLSIRR